MEFSKLLFLQLITRLYRQVHHPPMQRFQKLPSFPESITTCSVAIQH